MASDWFGGFGKDLTEFVGEVTQSVQKLQQPNEEEQLSSNQPYGAFASDSVLDSFFTSINDDEVNNEDDAEDKKENDAQTHDAPQTSTPPPAISTPPPAATSSTPPPATSSTPPTLIATPNIEMNKANASDGDTSMTCTVSEDENKTISNDTRDAKASNDIPQTQQMEAIHEVVPQKSITPSINNAESVNNDATAVDMKANTANDANNIKYEQLLKEKAHGDAKYKQLKGKFSKLHSKYKQIKEQNEKQNTLNEALKKNVNQITQLNQEEMDQMKERFASESAGLNEKIGNKQSKIQQLVKELNECAVMIEQKDISIQRYESEGRILRDKLDTLNTELAQHKDSIKQLEQENEALKTTPQSQEQKEGGDPAGSGVIEDTNQSPPSFVQQEMETLKAKHADELSNWKLMYEELEKTAFGAVQEKNEERLKSDAAMSELKEENERLEHNLKLREDQLEKATTKLSSSLKHMEESEERYNRANNNNNEEKWKKLIAAKDREIADILAEGEEWASNCHNLEQKQKKLLEQLADVSQKVQEKEERITALLQTIKSKKSESESIEERNKLLMKHKEETSLSSVQLQEEMIALRCKMRDIESERDEYVTMIENDKEIISKLNIEMNCDRERMGQYRDSALREEHLLNELKELRSEMKRIESRERSKYERVVRERSDEKQLRMAAEKRNEELSLEISFATQPLLRQMESLKSSHGERRKIWNKLENDLRQQIRGLESASNDCESKMNAILSDFDEYKMRQNKIEMMNKRLKEENKYCKMKCNEITDKFDAQQMAYDEQMNELEMCRNKMNEAETEKKNVAQQLAKFNRVHHNETNRFETILATENKKRQELQKTITILQMKVKEFNDAEVGNAAEKEEEVLSIASAAAIDGGGNNMWTVSRIQNELRHKENELKSLKQRLMNLQNTNDTFGDQIVKLKSQNEGLTKYHIAYKNQTKKINALKLRYEAAIDIVIEKDKQIQKLTNS
eukprot:450167_1